MKQLLLYCLLAILLPTAALAQSRQIKGKVTDDTGNPLNAVSVVLQGSKTGTQTDAEGNFSLTVTAAGRVTLSFSYTGFKSTTVATDGKTPVEVSLERVASNLEDVVVVGYSTVARKNLTGSVSSVSAKQIKDVPISSAEELFRAGLPVCRLLLPKVLPVLTLSFVFVVAVPSRRTIHLFTLLMVCK